MRLSIKTCTLDMPFAAMLDFCVAQGVQAVEIGTGNWSGAPHIDPDELLGSKRPGSAGWTSFAAGISPCAP